jgi:hypothetical protein
MNTKSRTLGAAALLAVLLGSAACGTETVKETDPGTQPAPAVETKGAPSGVSADALERKAAAEKERQDRASTDRWARGSNRPGYGHPGQP